MEFAGAIELFFLVLPSTHFWSISSPYNYLYVSHCVSHPGGLLKIKSAFCSGVKGLIYVEALSEAFAKEIIVGLRMIYGSSFSQVWKLCGMVGIELTKWCGFLLLLLFIGSGLVSL